MPQRRHFAPRIILKDEERFIVETKLAGLHPSAHGLQISLQALEEDVGEIVEHVLLERHLRKVDLVKEHLQVHEWIDQQLRFRFLD